MPILEHELNSEEDLSDDGISYSLTSNNSDLSLTSEERLKLKGIIMRLFGFSTYEDER
jgi:hypothetical protein